MKKTKKKKEVIEIENWNLVMALGSCKMKRGIETPESWVLCKTRVAFQKHLRLNQIAVPRRRHQPLAGSRTPKWIPHHTHTHTKWDQIFTMEALKNKETKSTEREEANLNAMGCGVYLWCEEIWKLCFRIWWGRNCDGDVAPSSLYLSNFVRQRRIKQKEGLKVVARNVIEVGVNGGFVIWCGTKGKGEQWTQHKFMKENEGSHFLFMFCSLLLSESCFDFFVCSSLFDTLVKILPIFF